MNNENEKIAKIGKAVGGWILVLLTLATIWSMWYPDSKFTTAIKNTLPNFDVSGAEYVDPEVAKHLLTPAQVKEIVSRKRTLEEIQLAATDDFYDDSCNAAFFMDQPGFKEAGWESLRPSTTDVPGSLHGTIQQLLRFGVRINGTMIDSILLTIECPRKFKWDDAKEKWVY